MMVLVSAMAGCHGWYYVWVPRPVDTAGYYEWLSAMFVQS